MRSGVLAASLALVLGLTGCEATGQPPVEATGQPPAGVQPDARKCREQVRVPIPVPHRRGDPPTVRRKQLDGGFAEARVRSRDDLAVASARRAAAAVELEPRDPLEQVGHGPVGLEDDGRLGRHLRVGVRVERAQLGRADRFSSSPRAA